METYEKEFQGKKYLFRKRLSVDGIEEVLFEMEKIATEKKSSNFKVVKKLAEAFILKCDGEDLPNNYFGDMDAVDILQFAEELYTLVDNQFVTEQTKKKLN